MSCKSLRKANRIQVHKALANAALFGLLLLIPILGLHAEDRLVALPDGRQVILHDDFTWEYYQVTKTPIDTLSIQDNKIPDFLRKGIAADKQTIITAVELYSQGWRYTMPRPKSAQASWGNGDHRTTWWNGYWQNEKAGAASQKDPMKRSSGLYYGDNQDLRGTWRNGGSPPTPTKIEWLLSSSGGIPPQ
jgi:hypothetical protein